MFSSLTLRQISRGVAFACLSLFTSVSANAASAPPKSSGGKHCLWRITNAKAPFYLLGSIHSMRKNDYPMSPVIDQAILESQQFYFEYDPRGDAELGRKLAVAAVLPKGVLIRQKINPRTWNFLMQMTVGNDYRWAGLRAWAIADYVLDYPVHERVSGTYGLDEYVVNRARARKRPMHGLETVDEHVNVYGGMSDIESEVYLLEAIVFAHQRDARYREIIKDWRAGDTERLFQVEMPDIQDAPGLNPRFLERRNVRWIPKIETAIKSGQPTMIVAGAMHFSGPHSVINMLRARGYKIEQL